MEQKNKETYWSQFTGEFEERQSRVVGNEILFLMKKELLKENNLGNVLELGCGTGLFTDSLNERSTKVVATDFSDEMIAFAQQKRSDLKNVEFRKADALNQEFEDSSFDTVFMANLIHVIGNAERVISESKRVLKTGGKLIITSFAMNEMNFFNRLSMGIRFIKTFGKPPDEANREKTKKNNIENLLVKYGFEISKSVILGKKSKAFYITCVKT